VIPANDWKDIGRTLVAELQIVPRGERLRFINAHVKQLPEEMQEPVSQFVAAAIHVMAIEVNEAKEMNQKMAVLFGAAFMVTLLGLAIVFPQPTPFQYQTFRIVLAIAVAGFAATIPGLLHVQVGNFVRASGALAVFAIVYFYNPAELVLTQPPPTPVKSGSPQ
jgi:hypothetical protein